MKKQFTIILIALLLGTPFSGIRAQETFPVNGVHDERHLVYAFINASIYTDYKTRLDKATLIIKDGIIQQVGVGVSVPAGAVTVDLKGKIIYPSFIDAFTDYGMPEIKKGQGGQDPQFLSNTKGAYSWNQAIKPEFVGKNVFVADTKKAEELRKLGFGSVQAIERDGIARGTSVFVTLADAKEHKVIVKEEVAACYSFDKGSSSQDYPSSLMGSIALLRQTYLDAKWYQHTNSREKNLSLEAWNKIQALPQIFETGDKQTFLRADKVGDEFGVQYIIKTGGDEYQRIPEVKSTKASLIVPINFPAGYDMDDAYDALNIQLGELKHWELAPSNPAALEKAGINFVLSSTDLKNKGDFWKNLRKAIEYGLTEQQALKALTHAPAELLGVADKVGSLKVGMLANFIVTSKSIFDKDNTIYSNWVQGTEYRLAEIDAPDLRGSYDVSLGAQMLKLKVAGDLTAPEFTILKDTTKIKANFSRSANLFTLQFTFKNGEPQGAIRVSGAIDGANLKGKAQLPDGIWTSFIANFKEPFVEAIKKDTVKKKPLELGSVTYPNRAYGWKELPKAGNVLIKNATVWTNEQEGQLKNTDILVQNGKITKIGKELSAGEGKDWQTIDATGKYVTAGIIDEHSHIAISRGVNEGTQAVTSEVRIGDVIDADDNDIYRQLSGGVTTSHLLHGSANPVGGQTTLIKLRWGQSPEQMKFEGSDGFIKFALGENVKQSNWGDRNVVRFPQTRMGVEQVYIDAFTRAKEYEKAWKSFQAAEGKGVEPRKDLELDALVEILNNKRFITCHSYVQSEINMLLHVADSMGFKVNTFTHILEGYKVADKMKVHGNNASTFADWWAYKMEVQEAIPFNAAILTKMGVNTSVNSDDAEMGRRLNQESAKAIKYGGLTEEEAFKLCTLNPAKMLHIDNRVGSIKVGKDADVVIWTDNPLSVYAKVEKTFVDGIAYFDAERDKELRKEIQKERARLIQKSIEAKAKGEPMQKSMRNAGGHYTCDTIGEEKEMDQCGE